MEIPERVIRGGSQDTVGEKRGGGEGEGGQEVDTRKNSEEGEGGSARCRDI